MECLPLIPFIVPKTDFSTYNVLNYHLDLAPNNMAIVVGISVIRLEGVVID